MTVLTAAKSWPDTSQSLDNGLYSAFGQSEVSVIYTQLNQYYVVLLEVAFRRIWQNPVGLNNIYFSFFRHREQCHGERQRSAFQRIWPRIMRPRFLWP